MRWYFAALEKYTVFRGRARRKEFWYFALFSTLILIALRASETVAGLSAPQARVGPLSGLYCLAVLLPSLAVSVRRLHDTNRSGWWLLIDLVPLIGIIVLLVFCAQRGQWGDNQYGPDPKTDPGHPASPPQPSMCSTARLESWSGQVFGSFAAPYAVEQDTRKGRG